MHTPAQKSKRINFGSNSIFYNNFNDLREQLDNIVDDNIVSLIDVSKIRINKIEQGSDGVHKPKSKPGKRKRSKMNEDIGFLGEYIVYKYLKSKPDDNLQVKWVSENAKLSGINLDGSDGQGYDIEYIPNGAAATRYVEVKVIGWDDAFPITANEVLIGEKQKSIMIYI